MRITALAMVVAVSSCADPEFDGNPGLCILSQREWVTLGSVGSKSWASHLVTGDDTFGQPGTFSVFDAQLSVKENLAGEAPTKIYVADDLVADGQPALMFMFRMNDRPYLSARAIAYSENDEFSIPTTGIPSSLEVVAEDQIAARIAAYRAGDPVDGGHNCLAALDSDRGE